RQRRFAGETKYPFWKMVQFAWTAISSFSALPLRLTLYGGMGLCCFGAAYTIYSLYRALIQHQVVPGWTSSVCLQMLFGGAILFAVGLMGDYVARIYEESKQRPLYIVNGTCNLPASQQVGRSIVFQRARRANSVAARF